MNPFFLNTLKVNMSCNQSKTILNTFNEYVIKEYPFYPNRLRVYLNWNKEWSEFLQREQATLQFLQITPGNVKWSLILTCECVVELRPFALMKEVTTLTELGKLYVEERELKD